MPPWWETIEAAHRRVRHAEKCIAVARRRRIAATPSTFIGMDPGCPSRSYVVVSLRAADVPDRISVRIQVSCVDFMKQLEVILQKLVLFREAVDVLHTA